MKPCLSFLALLTLFCAGVRAQNQAVHSLNLPQKVVNIAFIKGETGFIIDSVTVRTSLDTLPYGFPFKADTLFLDVSTFSPVGEIVVETFAAGNAFGRASCWVDPPTADIYLSILSGRTVIDSVGLSPVDKWYREQVQEINAMSNLFLVKSALNNSILNTIDNLLCTTFFEAYLDLPNLTREDINGMAFTVQSSLGPVRKHPRFTPILDKLKLMNSIEPGKLKKYALLDIEGNAAIVDAPESDFYILNFYATAVPASLGEHAFIQESLQADSLFRVIPIISINTDADPGRWQEYAQTPGFAWPHYHDPQTDTRKSLAGKLALYPGATYVLLDRRSRIVGVYDNLQKIAAALLWRRY